MRPIFITGIGTGVGKTVTAAIITEALQANYWKPVQTGLEEGTDANTIQALLSNTKSRVFDEVYKLHLPASPHIAAKEENVIIDTDKILARYEQLQKENDLMIVEGAGGLLVPLNDDEFILHLAKKLEARVILVSRNYLGSINHSLLTAAVCKQHNIDVIGWMFNDQFQSYEEDIVRWSGYPKIGSVQQAGTVSKLFVAEQAAAVRSSLQALL